MATLIPPYGGRLVSLVVTGDATAALRAEAGRLPSPVLTDRAACDQQGRSRHQHPAHRPGGFGDRPPRRRGRHRGHQRHRDGEQRAIGQAHLGHAPLVVEAAHDRPYRATRAECRAMVGAEQFVEVFVDTPLEVCESRDTKGLYAKARRGALTGFTGVNDPYEPPAAAEITLDTVQRSVADNARMILDELRRRGFVR
jgi:hypothetical protein